MAIETAIALGIFAATYAAMLSEKVHKTVAALLGGCAMVLFHVVSEKEAFASIDLSVLFLLTGMMVIVHFLAESGFFGYVAIRLAHMARGRPAPLLLLLCGVTGALSALVDNVTTVLLIAPVTFLIAQQLEVSPIPYLVFEALASNVGGTATLIGDPPNILIGSAADLGFNQFLANLTPVTVVCLVAVLAIAVLVIRKQSYVSMDIRARIMEMNPRRAVTDMTLLKQSGFVLGLVLVAFLFHEALGLKPATVALAGAALLLLITKADPGTAFKAVEWPTLFFFIGLFALVAGLVATGVLDTLAGALLALTGKNLFLTAMAIMWFAAIASAFLGNIPVTTTLIPVVHAVATSLDQQTGLGPETIRSALWWSFALGACFGGNGTMFGAAANVIVVDIARNNNQNITFGRFMAYSVPVTILTLVLSSIYVYLRYAP